MIVHSYKLLKLNYVWLMVVDNPYFINIINFVKYKFDVELLQNTIIFIGGNYASIIPEYRKKYPEKTIVIYNWEQLCGGNKWLNVGNLCESMKLADEIWDYNDLNTVYLKKYFNIDVAHVYPIEYFPDLVKTKNKKEPSIDVLFYGLLNERRANIVSQLQIKMYNKFSFIIALGLSSDEINKYIADSKIVLNLHAFAPYHRQEQERIGFLLANNKCVLSEVSQENYFGNAIVESDVDNMYSSILSLLDNNNWKVFSTLGSKAFKNGNCEKIVNY